MIDDYTNSDQMQFQKRLTCFILIKVIEQIKKDRYFQEIRMLSIQETIFQVKSSITTIYAFFKNMKKILKCKNLLELASINDNNHQYDFYQLINTFFKCFLIVLFNIFLHFKYFQFLPRSFIDLKQVHALELCYLQYSSQQMSFYINLRLISLLTLATCILAQNFSQFAQRKVTSTIVTGWWPSGDSSTTPKGEVEASFTKLLSLPLNIVIFGPASLQEFINQKKSKANTKFVALQAEDIEKTWFKKIVNDLKKNGKNPSVKDKVCQTLSYARMWLLNSALTHDSFGSQELIWADINAINQPHIASVLDDKNLNTLLLAFKHHFFMVTSPKNEAHSYPNIQKTYFEAKYDIFTSSALFGGKRQAITTVYRLFDDQMKVAIEYDRNLWSEDALFSLLADRSPYLVSYFTPQAPSGPQKRVLIETTIQDEKRQLDSYQTKIKYCEYVILLIAILIAFQIIRFVNSVKRLNKVLENRSTVESQQMSKVNQSRD